MTWPQGGRGPTNQTSCGGSGEDGQLREQCAVHSGGKVVPPPTAGCCTCRRRQVRHHIGSAHIRPRPPPTQHSHALPAGPAAHLGARQQRGECCCASWRDPRRASLQVAGHKLLVVRQPRQRLRRRAEGFYSCLSRHIHPKGHRGRPVGGGARRTAVSFLPRCQLPAVRCSRPLANCGRLLLCRPEASWQKSAGQKLNR